MTRYIGGSLSALSELKNHIKDEKLLTHATPRRIENKAYEILVFQDSESIKGASFNLMMGYYLAQFYEDPSEEMPTKEALVTCIAGIICNAAEWRTIRPWTKVVSAFTEAGIALEIKEILATDIRTLAATESKFKRFLKRWDSDIKNIIANSNLFFIMASVMILGMTKSLTVNNFTPWMKRRIATFSEAVGDPRAVDLIADTQYPSMSLMQTLYGVLSVNQQIRRALYLEVLSIAKSQENNFIKKSFNEINHLMRNFEMTHLVMIDKYIFEEHPEFLSTILLRGLKPRFANAIKYLRTLPPENQMYARLLYSKDECAALNRRAFEDAHTVALTIAQCKNSTFNNFYNNQNPAHVKTRDLVNRYLDLRYNLTGLRLGGVEEGKTMSEREAQVYYEKVLLQLEKDSNLSTEDDDIFNAIEMPTTEAGVGV